MLPVQAAEVRDGGSTGMYMYILGILVGAWSYYLSFGRNRDAELPP